MINRLPNRRALVAAFTGAVASAAVALRGADHAPTVEARRAQNRPTIEGPCGRNPEKNLCKKDRDCCTDYCDGHRCRYKALGDRCTSNKQCRPDRFCVDGTCTAEAVPTLTPSATVSPTATGVPEWTNQTTFGSTGSGANQLDRPSSVALTADGRTAIIADADNNRISVWTRSSSTSTDWANSTTFGSAGNGAGQFNQPRGVALTANELTLLVADMDNNRVSIWSRSTTSATDWAFVTSFGTLGPNLGDLNSPDNVSLSADGLSVFVTEVANNRISVFSRLSTSSNSWSPVTQFGSSINFIGPSGGTLSTNQLMFTVSAIYSNWVSVWTRSTTSSTDWAYSTIFGSAGQGTGNLMSPYAVTTSSDGLTAYVSDSSNGRISIWTRPDTSSTTWTNTSSFGTSGSATNQLSYPYSVTLYDGKAFVADSNNDRISIWLPPA